MRWRFCPDTRNIHFEDQSSSVGTQKGNRCSNVRPPWSQHSWSCKGSSTSRESGSLLPTDRCKHFGSTAMSKNQQVSLLIGLPLLRLFFFLFCFSIWSAMPSFLATQTLHVPVSGRGSESYTRIPILIPPFTSYVTLDNLCNIFYA